MNKEELQQVFGGNFGKGYSSEIDLLSIRDRSKGRQLYIVSEEESTYILYRNGYPDDQHDFSTRKIGKLPALRDFSEKDLEVQKDFIL